MNQEQLGVLFLDIREQLEHVVTRDDLEKMTNEIIGKIDSFIKLHEILDNERRLQVA